MQDEHHVILLDAVFTALGELKTCLSRLTTSFRAENGPVWVQAGDRMLSADKDAVIQIISQLEYDNEQEGRETVVRPGLVGVNEKTLNEVKALNRAKDNFKAQIQVFRQAANVSSKIQFHHYVNHLFDASPMLLRHALRRQGFDRLHLKQCYRHVPILETQPYKVSWTWTHTRSVSKISLKEAESRLSKMPMDVGVAQQLRKLQLLSPAEHLAIVQELAPHCCANIVLDQEKTQRQMLKSPIPIFYLVDPSKELPLVVPPTTCREKNAERRERSDIKIDKEPYLPAIRAHRYLAFSS